ncbi:MAG TPA: type III pantothenate kinase [Gracilimonas sp.]|uniref:type III pantothenate kinase n=1 Tax=Gracilimonas sp. TaxID=1974203 RepID=UPI002D977B36|nr:type III pantothenate kinase [Gracilimonas sp.]
MSKIDSKTSNNILYLDAGNSSIKGAHKRGVKWNVVDTKKTVTALEFIEWIDTHPESFTEVILASVRKDLQEAILEHLKHVKLRQISVSDIPRDLLDYETPETLGIDRFLACYGATNQTSKSVVVIDAGTAITIDFMDQDDVYRGGLIAPGLSGFGEILHQKAPALPEVEMDIPKIWPGKNTIDSLKWGQAGFYKMAIEAILKKYESEFGPFDLFITGGWGSFLESIIEREGKLRPFLVFDGMERMSKESKIPK